MNILPTVVPINDDFFEPQGWHKAYGRIALILKKVNEEYYTHVYIDTLSLFRLAIFKTSLPETYNDKQEPSYNDNSLFKISNEYNFKIAYELDDKWIGYLLDHDNQKVYECEHEDLTKTTDGCFVLINLNKYKNNIVKFEEKLYQSDEELESVLDYNTDLAIVKQLNHPLCHDFHGRLRFQEQLLTDKEQALYDDLNNAWMSYYDKKVSFSEMLKLYMKINYSLDGFMEVYYECFLKPNPEMSEDDYEDEDDMMDDRVCCNEDEIKKIVSGEMEPFNKNR